MTPWIFLVISLWVVFSEGKNKQLGEKTKIERIDPDLLKKSSYSRQDPPFLEGVTDVALGILVNSFYAISEQTMDYSVNLYLRQSWTDPRLAYVPVDNKTEKLKIETAWQEIWVPDTFFRNEKRSNFHSVTLDNRMTTVTPTGFVWYVMKISATFSCPMMLHNYPLDTQICPLTFESFGYTTDTVRLAWMEKPVVMSEDVNLPQFDYKGHVQADCSQNRSSGNVPCLEVRFTFQRSLGYFMIQVYVPSILIVILSWVSFWINVDAAPARVSLGLLTVLTTTTQSSGVNASLPRVSYIKAIDVWTSVCLIFVFTALLEYAFVNASMRSKGSNDGRQIVASPSKMIPPTHEKQTFDIKGNRPEQIENKSKECGSCIELLNIRCLDRDEQTGPGGIASAQKTGKPLSIDSKARAKGIDKIARKSFPLAFILFNIVYWIGYGVQSM